MITLLLMGSNCKTLERFIADRENSMYPAERRSNWSLSSFSRCAQMEVLCVERIELADRQYAHCSSLAPRKTQFPARRRFACCRRRMLCCGIAREEYLFWLTPAVFHIGRKCSVWCDKMREMNTNMINQIKVVLCRCSGSLKNTSRLKFYLFYFLILNLRNWMEDVHGLVSN